ncbi:MAG: hypothetical protein WDM92_09715 [Caulobacteraceae bacterium]
MLTTTLPSAATVLAQGGARRGMPVVAMHPPQLRLARPAHRLGDGRSAGQRRSRLLGGGGLRRRRLLGRRRAAAGAEREQGGGAQPADRFHQDRTRHKELPTFT